MIEKPRNKIPLKSQRIHDKIILTLYTFFSRIIRERIILNIINTKDGTLLLLLLLRSHENTDRIKKKKNLGRYNIIVIIFPPSV